MPDRPLSTLPVVILCGGLGTRLRSAVSDRPKALAPVGDRPFLELQIELLREQGARHFVLCVGHMADRVQAAFSDGHAFGVQIEYSCEGETLLGTGGALRLAARYFAPTAVVVNGDTYMDFDHNRLIEHHLWTGGVATLTLARLNDPRRFGSVDLDAMNQIAGFREKDPTGTSSAAWLNAGAYVIDRELIDRIPDGMAVSLEREVFPAAIRDGLVIAGLTCERAFYDIGTPEDFRAFQARFEEIRRAA